MNASSESAPTSWRARVGWLLDRLGQLSLPLGVGLALAAGLLRRSRRSGIARSRQENTPAPGRERA